MEDASDSTGDYVQPYSPCVLILPDGRVTRGKSVRTRKLMTVDAALAALAGQGRAVVTPKDEETVLGKLAGMV